jgi:hypothetical protein
MGANVPGVDFITATSDGSEIIVTDVKTSEVGRFPAAKNQIPGSWQTEVDAVSRGCRWKIPPSRSGSGLRTVRSGCVSDSSVRTTRPKAKAR